MDPFPEVVEIMNEILDRVDQLTAEKGPNHNEYNDEVSGSVGGNALNEVDQPTANNLMMTGLNPFLIVNILDVLLPKLTKKKIFDVRSVCKLWDERSCQEINRRPSLCSVIFRTNASVANFFQTFEHHELHPHFSSIEIHGCHILDFLIDHQNFNQIFNNLEKFHLFMLNDVLNLDTFNQMNRSICATVQDVKVKFQDNSEFNHRWTNIINMDWPQDIDFPELKKLNLDIIPIRRFRYLVPDTPMNSDESVRFLNMYIHQAPNLTNLKMTSENPITVDVLLHYQGFEVMLKRLDSLEIFINREMTAYWSRIRLQILAQQQKVQLKHFGITCLYNLHHNISPNLNRLEIEYEQIYHFLNLMSTSLESLKLSIYQAGPHFLTSLSLPPMMFLQKLTLTSEGLISISSNYFNYPNPDERPKNALPVLDLTVGYPVLTHLKFVGRGLYLRNFFRAGYLASASVVDLEIKRMNFGLDAEFDPTFVYSWFPNLQRLYLNKCNMRISSNVTADSLRWPLSLNEVEIKIPSAMLTVFNFNYFIRATGLRVLKISEWKEFDAVRTVARPNLNLLSKIMDRIEKLAFRGFMVDKSFVLGLEQRFAGKLDIDYTTRNDICYL